MATKDKTKQQLLDELLVLQNRLSELEKEAKQAQQDFGEKMGRYFPQLEQMNEAIYVIFDRKYEFVNQRFADMFGVTQEEVCHPHFDLMQLIAPESRRFVREKYRQGFHGEYPTQQFEFAGMTKDGTKIECETFVLYIPYKWGVAMHGTVASWKDPRRTSVSSAPPWPCSGTMRPGATFSRPSPPLPVSGKAVNPHAEPEPPPPDAIEVAVEQPGKRLRRTRPTRPRGRPSPGGGDFRERRARGLTHIADAGGSARSSVAGSSSPSSAPPTRSSPATSRRQRGHMATWAAATATAQAAESRPRSSSASRRRGDG